MSSEIACQVPRPSYFLSTSVADTSFLSQSTSPAAKAALRQKKAYENELDRIAGTRMTLETQVNAIESANMNLETMQAMRRGADALKNIHGSL